MKSAIISNQQSHWFVVADHARVKIYTRATRRGALSEFKTIDNHLAKKKVEDLISDRSGRSFDSHGKGRHTLAGDEKGPKKHVAKAFAREIAEQIHKAKLNGTCADFGLIATPTFLGELREALSVHANTRPLFSIDKDVVNQSPEFIEKLIENR